MPSVKKRSKKEVEAKEENDGRGDGFMALEEDAEEAPRGRRQTASPSQPPAKKAGASEQGSRVMFIGNLPHGFYERRLLGFFTQFGKVTRVRLSRNKKSGKAKHYAFLEFQYPDVARIAADAMDGYFIFKQKLTCMIIPTDKIHPLLFKGANKKFRDVPWRKLERQRHDKDRSQEEHCRRVARLIKADKQRQKKILEAGIDYEYQGLEDLPIQPKRIVISD